MAKSAYDKRFEQTLEEMKRIYNVDWLRPRGEMKLVDAELCSDLENDCYTDSWLKLKIPAGSYGLSKFLKENDLKRCKKSEASFLMVVGEKTETGLFQIGKYKNYWLKAA